MRSCRRCANAYSGEPLYCDPCEEYRRQIWREHFGEPPKPRLRHCPSCGRFYHPATFHFHRTRTDWEEERERALGARHGGAGQARDKARGLRRSSLSPARPLPRRRRPAPY